MSDIDLMVVSDDLAYPELFKTLENASRRLGRPVNPTLYSVSELEKRIRERNSFAVRVLKQPKIWRVLAKCHEIRNRGEYEGDLSVEDRLVKDLIIRKGARR